MTRKEAIEKLHEARQLALRNIEKSQAKMKTRYDNTHQDGAYQPGDIVRVFTPTRIQGMSEKLLTRFYGPYKIIRQTSPVNYEVELINQRGRARKSDVVHVSKIKPVTLCPVINEWEDTREATEDYEKSDDEVDINDNNTDGADDVSQPTQITNPMQRSPLMSENSEVISSPATRV